MTAARERWSLRDECEHPTKDRRLEVHIWSNEHGLYWRAERAGYTSDRTKAGVYTIDDAYDSTWHCGPEKGIYFVTANPVPDDSVERQLVRANLRLTLAVEALRRIASSSASAKALQVLALAVLTEMGVEHEP